MAIITLFFNIIGLSLFVYGSWLAWHPLGFIMAGLWFVLAGVAIRKAEVEEKEREKEKKPVVGQHSVQTFWREMELRAAKAKAMRSCQ